jgi:putative transposase
MRDGFKQDFAAQALHGFDGGLHLPPLGNGVLKPVLQLMGVDLIARVSVRNRKVDFRQAGRRWGPLDALFTWSKPKTPSPLLSGLEWLGLPPQITVRVLRLRLEKKGFRTRHLTLVTTLLEAALFPAEELLAAHARRWRMELCLDDLKTTLGMQSLHCLGPRMVQKELLLFLTAHNFLRWIMAEAAQSQNADLDRISFKGSLDAFLQWTQALAQLGHAKNKRSQRRLLWQRLLRTLAADRVADRPGRKEPRAVKKRSKYPHLNKSRHLYRQPWSRNKRRRLARAKRKASLV